VLVLISVGVFVLCYVILPSIYSFEFFFIFGLLIIDYGLVDTLDFNVIMYISISRIFEKFYKVLN
jgi:hypothetical protein